MDDSTRKIELARRAVKAAEARGLSTDRLECCASGYGVETGPWMGELLALVRKAWCGRRLACLNIGKGWRVGDGLGWAGPVADSETEALDAALEAAPGGGS